ncbi:MAG: hypothetical protein K2Q23_06950 [Bryobacteraceae bacterium]|nr:hypothetical protein [Bryobacteraceae bacterium]
MSSVAAGVATAATREELRAQAGVQIVKPENEGFALVKQPNSTYGFSYAPMNECPVYQKQTFQVFEVHKRADGSRWVLGYVSPEDDETLNSGREPVDITLYPEPHETAQKLVAVDMARSMKAKPASRIDGNFIKLTLGKL